MYLNITLASTLRFPQDLSFLRFSEENFVCISHISVNRSHNFQVSYCKDCHMASSHNGDVVCRGSQIIK